METTPVTITAEKAKEIQKFTIQKELALQRSMHSQAHTNSQQQMMIFRLIGIAKLQCLIRHKFECRAEQVQAAILKFNIKEDEEIKSFIKMAKVQMQSER